MLKRMLHRIVAHPQVYDAVQRLAGASKVERLLSRRVPGRDRAARVLDVGGGTGISRNLWPDDCTYICLDVDMEKLRGFSQKHITGSPLLADATRIPIRDGSLDTVLCKLVTHHLTDQAMSALIDESARVLKDDGIFVFMDAVWAPRRPAGRLLWSLDRGTNPRRADTLRACISRRFRIRHWEHFSIYHEYVLCIGTRAGEHLAPEAGTLSD